MNKSESLFPFWLYSTLERKKRKLINVNHRGWRKHLAHGRKRLEVQVDLLETLCDNWEQWCLGKLSRAQEGTMRVVALEDIRRGEACELTMYPKTGNITIKRAEANR